MENGIFFSLKAYVNDNTKYTDCLKAAYFKKEISISEILSYRENGLVINTYGLNELGVHLYNEGTDIDSAQNLFLVAMEHGCHNGKYNYAFCLVFKKNLDLERAIQLFSEVASQNFNLDSVDYCIGMAYLQLKDYVRAYRHFKRVPEKEEGKDNIYFTYSKEKMIGTLNIILEQSFSKMDIKEAKKQEKNDPWYSIVEDFDGFDPYFNEKDALHLKKLELEYELAKIEYLDAKKNLDAAESKGKETQVEEMKVLMAKEKEAKARKVDKKCKILIFRESRNDDKSAKNKERRRQVQTEKHFFHSRRIRSEKTKELATKLQVNRLVQDPKLVSSVDVTDYPARTLITAELAAVRASLTAEGRVFRYNNFAIWNIARTSRERSESGNLYDLNYGNNETILLGQVSFRYSHKINPHSNHIGDFYCIDLGDYEQICRSLRYIAGSPPGKPNRPNEAIIANWMLRYSKSGIVVSLEDLRDLKRDDNPQADANDNTIEILMRIFFLCLVKEPARWMNAADDSHDLPFATAQSRAIKLIAKGFLSLEEVFDQYAPYGIFTGKKIGEHIDSVIKKINRINKLYKECILTREDQNFQPYFHFMREHEMGKIVTSRKHLRQELIETYGGDQDSDGEGYTSDNAEDLYPSVFKF